MIDFHVHLGDTARVIAKQRPPLSAHQLIDIMNRNGIEQTVLLPLESPEAACGFYLTEHALEQAALYPERLIPFVSIDPRQSRAADNIDYFISRGCRGFGELKNGLAFDDERNLAIYRKCDELGLCLVFHSDPTLCFDEVGLPRLEKCLKQFPNVKWVGHGPGFWAAISGDDQRAGGYPKGRIEPGGAIDRLLGEYDNLYADISAGSGYNALTRDPEIIQGFLQRHWRKLLFATDLMFAFQKLPQIAWLRAEGPLTSEMREAIARGNARKLLGMA